MHKKANPSAFAKAASAFKEWKSTHRTPHFSPAILAVAGLGLLTAAAWTVALPLGLAVGGISCFVLEWRIGEK